MQTQIFLPENPFREFYNHLLDSALAMSPRVCIASNGINQFDNAESFKEIFYSNRIKLYDQTDFHMSLIPFSNYVKDQAEIYNHQKINHDYD